MQPDVHHVRVAEEVVQVAQRLLVGTHQEGRQEVVLALVQFMQLERALDVAQADEVVDLAVGVAGDVSQHGLARGHFIQPVDRHDREQLVDGPAVG